MPNTREKLIELLSQVQYLGGLEEKIADHLIANGVTVQKWIPVTERLPEAQQRVLAITDRGYIRMDCIHKKNGTWFGEMFEPSKVTHWMPLPEAPKGE